MASAGASGHSTMTPACNRLLQKKWDDKKFREHKDRLRKIKSSVDNGMPRNFVHIRQNLRKQKIEEDRQNTIQRHNNELLSRMHHIMHTTGRVDHRNADWRPKKSLNYIKRQNEMDRIHRENRAILRRIETVRPQYNTRQWESDYHTHATRMKAMALFPQIPGTSPPRPEKQSPSKTDPVRLPPITSDKTSRPETQPNSEIQEEIDVDD